MTRFSYRWAVVAAAFASVAAPSVRAQSASPCAAAVAAADTLYRAGRFADVDARLGACAGPDAEAPAEAYRLLTLSLLRQQRLAEAQEAVVQLLAAYPDYTPDMVQDPPVYVSLVTLVSRQLGTDARLLAADEPPAQPSPPVPTARPMLAVGTLPTVPGEDSAALARRLSPMDRTPGRLTAPAETPAADDPSADTLSRQRTLRAPDAVTVEVAVGTAAYTGRDLNGERAGFAETGAPTLSVGVAFQADRRFSAGIRAQSLLLQKLRAGDPDIDPAVSGRRVLSLTAEARFDLAPGAVVSPYARLGAWALFRSVNRTTLGGIGPTGALGVEARATSWSGVFGEVTAGAVTPDDLLDSVLLQTHGSVLFGGRIGLRVLLAHIGP